MIENLKIMLKRSPKLEKNNTSEFDQSRAYLTKPDLFPRFSIENYTPIHQLDLNDSDYVIVTQIKDQKIGVLAKQMSYHHVAQGNYQDTPFVIAFCIVCHSAMGLIPIVDNELHHFSVGGLYDGLAVLVDDETNTYWEHISGKALSGPLTGNFLPTFSVEVTTVKEPKDNSKDILIGYSKQSIFGKFSSAFLSKGSLYHENGSFPPGFRKTMRRLDKRLDPFTAGLGIIINNNEPTEARFYLNEDLKEGYIVDFINGRKVMIRIDPSSKLPVAYFAESIDSLDDTEKLEKPHQIFSRRYGFSYTYRTVKIRRESINSFRFNPESMKNQRILLTNF